MDLFGMGFVYDTLSIRARHCIIHGFPSSSSSLYIWNQGVDRYLIYWLAWELGSKYRELEDEGWLNHQLVSHGLVSSFHIHGPQSMVHLNGRCPLRCPTECQSTEVARQISAKMPGGIRTIFAGQIIVTQKNTAKNVEKWW